MKNRSTDAVMCMNFQCEAHGLGTIHIEHSQGLPNDLQLLTQINALAVGFLDGVCEVTKMKMKKQQVSNTNNASYDDK